MTRCSRSWSARPGIAVTKRDSVRSERLSKSVNPQQFVRKVVSAIGARETSGQRSKRLGVPDGGQHGRVVTACTLNGVRGEVCVSCIDECLAARQSCRECCQHDCMVARQNELCDRDGVWHRVWPMLPARLCVHRTVRKADNEVAIG